MPTLEGRTILVDDDRAAGFAHSVGGTLDDAVGRLTGDAPAQARGEAEQRAGQARGMWGQAVDAVRDFTADQPVVAVLSAVSFGAVVGFLTNRR